MAPDTSETQDTAADTGFDGCLRDELGVVIGTGEYSFESLEQGDPVIMVHGPQGGWHVLGSVRVEHTTQIVRVDYTITATEHDAVVAENTYQVALVMEDECSGYFPGMYGYLDMEEIKQGDADTPPELLAYQDLLLEMIVTDRDGRTGSREITVTAVPDPADLKAKDTGLVPGF